MMLAAAGLIFLTGMAQETKTFQDKETGLTFSYPSGWDYRKERLYSIFSIPLEGGKKAQVQVINVNFRQEPTAWQTAQSDVAKTMNRTVDRQWDEVILGVPLLLTQLTYKEGDAAMGSLVGLLYSRTPAKLSFRLTTSAEGYAQAEGLWRGALNSLRTISGSLPTSEDPTKPPQGGLSGGSSEGPKVTQIAPDKVRAPKLPKGVKREAMDVLGQKMVLILPKAWNLVKKESAYFLNKSDWDGEVILDFGAGSLADMRNAVLAASNSSGAFLSQILHRTESGPVLNSAGANLFMIERQGKGVISEGKEFDGAIVTTGGHAGLYYWVTNLQVEAGKPQKKGTDVIKELHKVLLLSPQP
jgi:hypothetical protein